MSRQFNPKTLQILTVLQNAGGFMDAKKLYLSAAAGDLPYKEFYNILFRLSELGLVTKQKIKGGLNLQLTTEGKNFINRKLPKKDGVWKIVIFDIPEKQKKIRAILRAKLKELYFQKWQNSIWISPFALDQEVEAEFNELSKKFFVRLIKTKEINQTDDLEKLFI